MNNKSLMPKTADYHIHECSFGSGMFFQQGAAQCDCLHSVAPADLIPTMNIPILYFNGSEDLVILKTNGCNYARMNDLSLNCMMVVTISFVMIVDLLMIC